MNTPSILVSGASIAGPALAHRLARAGWEVVVVERSEHLREEGQNVDVRGPGRDVLRRMGLEDLVRAAHTGERGLDYVDDDGAVVASFDAEHGSGTAELEVLRGQLARILVDHSRAGCQYVFNEQITALHAHEHGVDVEFLHRSPRRFDVVAIAEGLRSRTRTMVYPTAAVHELGLYSAYLTVPRLPTDDDRWRWFYSDRGRTVGLRPDNVGTTRASLGVLSDVRGLDRLARADVTAILRATFADAGWQTPRILDALDDAPLYVESFGQMRLPRWSHGRIVLVGDAAYCASPDSGVGTTLALTGAHILGSELAAGPDPVTAAARYESVMRPVVRRAQRLGLGVPRIEHPRTRWERRLLWARLRARARVRPIVELATRP